MKKTYIIFAIVLLTLTGWAQSPKKMSYQAVIRNTSNALITNSSICMKISILSGSSSGPAVYVETHTPTTNSNGLASIEIGRGTVVSGNFPLINWSNGPFFIKTETDPDGLTGGITYTIIGTNQLLSVPYALFAEKTGGTTSGGDFSHYIGEAFGGGVIFHLWKDSWGIEHGLVVSLTNISTSQIWSNITTTAVGSSAQSFWDGLNNSNSIIGQVGHTNSAAKLCRDFVGGGQNDWYLPSIKELNTLYYNLLPVFNTLSQINGATIITTESYWSSTEDGYNTAWGFGFEFGQIFAGTKTHSRNVRAIRAF